MTKNKEKKEKVLIANILGFPLIVCVCYLLCSIFMLIPYAIKFYNNQYIIEPNDLPNYSDIFNSIFVVLNIIVSSILSYMIYKLYKNQYNATYNKDVSGPSVLLYYTLKFNIMRSISHFLQENIADLKEEKYIMQKDKKPKCAIQYIKETKCPKLDYTKEIKEQVPSVIGYIEDKHIQHRLFMIFQDLYSNNIDGRLVYVLSDKLIKDYKLIEKSSNKWVYIISNIYKDNWEDLNSDYKELMEKLYELSETKK